MKCRKYFIFFVVCRYDYGDQRHPLSIRRGFGSCPPGQFFDFEGYPCSGHCFFKRDDRGRFTLKQLCERLKFPPMTFVLCGLLYRRVSFLVIYCEISEVVQYHHLPLSEYLDAFSVSSSVSDCRIEQCGDRAVWVVQCRNKIVSSYST